VNLPVIVRQSITSGESRPTADPWVNTPHGISSVVVSSSLSVISQRGTNPGRWVAQVIKFCKLAPNICKFRYETCLMSPLWR